MVVLEVAVLAAGHAGEEPREQLLAHAAVRHHKQPPTGRAAGRRAAAAAAAPAVLLRRTCAHNNSGIQSQNTDKSVNASMRQAFDESQNTGSTRCKVSYRLQTQYGKAVS